MRAFYCFLFAALLATNIHAEQKPNIVFVLSDDHAVQSIGCYGTHFKDYDPTPHIDSLANEGVCFANSFVQNSICAPSRAAILTGKYSHNNGVRAWEEFDGSQQTMPKLLQQAGYHTILVGKWHLKSDPTGFDEWTILPGQGDYFQPKFLDATHNIKNPIQKQGYVAEIITRMAEESIRNHSGGKPLALFVHHKSAHTPFLCDPRDKEWLVGETLPEPETLRDEWEGRPAIAKAHNKVPNIAALHRSFDENGVKKKGAKERFSDPIEKSMTVQQRNSHRYQNYIKAYLRTARSIDRSVGELMAVLEDEKMIDNTAFIYMSDQGFYLGEHGMGDKRWAYEESIRTPLIVRYPGGVKSKNVDAFAMNVDIAPTLLSIADIEVPDDIQGRDLSPFLTGKTPDNWRESVYYRYYDSKGYNIPEHQAVRTASYKLIYFPAAKRYELFDMRSAPVEMKNLARDDKHPRTLNTMKAKLAATKTQVGDNDPDIGRPQPNHVSTPRSPSTSSDGLAVEKIDINARDTSVQKEASIEYLKEPIVSVQPSDLKDGISVGSLASTICDQVAIRSLTDAVSNGKYQNVDSLLIAHKGSLVLESYYRRGRPDVPHYQMSITKSVTALTLGRAMQLGYINDLSTPVVDYLAEVDRSMLVDGATEITIAECLNMHSGIRIPEARAKAAVRQRRKAKGQGQVQMILSTTDPVTAESKNHKYQGTDPTLVMQVIDAIVPGSAEDFIRKEVLQPLGITSYSWQSDVSGLPKAAAGSSIRSRDMLKLGLLIADNGKWNGRQLWSEDFIKTAVSPLYTNKVGDTYGYLWWGSEMQIGGKEHHCISARGAGGQFIFIVPTMDLIVVVTSHNKSKAMRLPFELMKNELLPAFATDRAR